MSATVLSVAGVGGAPVAPRAATTSSWHDIPHVLNYPYFGGDWPRTFDPANATDTLVVSLLYDNLVRLDARNRPLPDLARSWDESADGRVYTFHLRTDTRFSDGKPITADDVLYSLDRALNPRAYDGKAPSPVASLYLGHIAGASSYTGKGDVAGLARIDAHTVRIRLDSPIAFFLQTLSYPTGDIVEKGTPIGGLTAVNPLLHQVSSGPWKISAFRYRSALTFVPNPDYFAYRRMKLREIDMPMVSDLGTLYQGYESGQYAMTLVPTNRLEQVRTLPDVHSSPVLSISYIVYNFAKPPFNNKALRLATSYAIDRDAINTQVLHGERQTIYSFIPEGIPGYDAAGYRYVPHYDPALARRYLALARKQLGATFPTSLTMRIPLGDSDVTHEYVEMQHDWAVIGLDVKLQGADAGTMANLQVKPTTSLTYTGGDPWLSQGWFADYADAQDFTDNLLSASSPYNIGNYDNPAFESLIALARTARGPERAQLYIRASRLALADGAVAVLGQATQHWRWRKTITGLALWNDVIFPTPIDRDWTNVDVR